MSSRAWPSVEKVRYSQVGDDETDVSSNSERIFDNDSKLRRQSCIWIFAISQSIAIIILLVFLHIVAERRPSDLGCARQLSPYSPFLETGSVEYEEYTDQNGRLTESSPYEGSPSPELEERWTKLWRVPMIRFPDEGMEALNKTPAENWVHVDPKYGEGVLGWLNVFHQLHCLNLVRQYTYRDRYDYSNASSFNQSEKFLRSHVDHCLEIIRKGLVCTADVTPMVFLPSEENKLGYDADFNMRRKCKNFDNIRRWAYENRADP